MICGKGGFKALTRHLSQTHQIKPTEYRKMFNIPKTQALMSKSYAAKRKEIAAGMDLTGNLEKARAAVKLVVRKGNKRENVK
jgi:predicted transcriptional regulator